MIKKNINPVLFKIMKLKKELHGGPGWTSNPWKYNFYMSSTILFTMISHIHRFFMVFPYRKVLLMLWRTETISVILTDELLFLSQRKNWENSVLIQ